MTRCTDDPIASVTTTSTSNLQVGEPRSLSHPSPSLAFRCDLSCRFFVALRVLRVSGNSRLGYVLRDLSLVFIQGFDARIFRDVGDAGGVRNGGVLSGKQVALLVACCQL